MTLLGPCLVCKHACKLNRELTVVVYPSVNGCLFPSASAKAGWHLGQVCPRCHLSEKCYIDKDYNCYCKQKKSQLTWFCGSGGWLWASGAWPWPWLSLPPTGEPRVVAVMLATGQILAILASYGALARREITATSAAERREERLDTRDRDTSWRSGRAAETIA